MANNPKKVKDPTEVALSAIQEALNISDTAVDTSRSSIGNDLAPPNIPSAAPVYSETPFDTRGSAERQIAVLIGGQIRLQRVAPALPRCAMHFGADRCKSLRHCPGASSSLRMNIRVKATSSVAKGGIPSRWEHAPDHASALSLSVADP